MRIIPVSYHGQILEALVDDEDFDRLSAQRWYGHVSHPGATSMYAMTSRSRYMHREVLQVVGRNRKVDHIDFNTLNNQKSNLRILSNSDNVRRRSGPPKHNTSGIIGVSYCSGSGRWEGKIFVRDQCIRKSFKTREEAAKFRKELEQRWVK